MSTTSTTSKPIQEVLVYVGDRLEAIKSNMSMAQAIEEVIPKSWTQLHYKASGNTAEATYSNTSGTLIYVTAAQTDHLTTGDPIHSEPPMQRSIWKCGPHSETVVGAFMVKSGQLRLLAWIDQGAQCYRWQHRSHIELTWSDCAGAMGRYTSTESAALRQLADNMVSQ